MSTAFDPVRLPEDIETGAAVGPQFDTGVTALSGGGEQRNRNWAQEKLVADISYGVMAKADPEDIENSFIRILSFYRARFGRLRSFLFRDPTDFESDPNEALYLSGDRQSAQLTRQYGQYLRRVTRPDVGTLKLFRADAQGAIIAEVPTSGGNTVPAWTIGELGKISFAQAVPADVYLVANFVFDIVMRFESDVMQVVIAHEQAGSIASIKIVQVPE